MKKSSPTKNTMKAEAPSRTERAESKLKRKDYEKELQRLQAELCALQDWVRHTGQRIVIVFEGRDAAGKGGTIKAITERVSPRIFRVVTVSFANHRVVDPATTEEEARRLLKRRAFDHLLGIALGRIAHVRKKRAGLEQQRMLLRRKLMVLRSGRWGFDEARGRAVSDVAAVETQLGEIEEQLQELGADAGVLQFHLDILSEVLSRAEQQLWATPVPLILDRMNIKRDHARGNAHEIALQELHSASGRTAILLPVVVPRSELRPRRRPACRGAALPCLNSERGRKQPYRRDPQRLGPATIGAFGG